MIEASVPGPPTSPCTVPGCPATAAGRWQVCDSHGAEAGQILAAIRDNVLDTLDATPRGVQAGSEPVHGGPLKSHRNIGDLDIMVLRDRRSKERSADDPDGNNTRGLLEVLHAYATDVREGRGFITPPVQAVTLVAWRRPGPYCDRWCRHASCYEAQFRHLVPWRPTVGSERKLLADHLDWALGQDFAADMLAELRQVERALDVAARQQPVGVCGGCGGELWGEDDRGGYRVRCAGCGTILAGLALATLRRRRVA